MNMPLALILVGGMLLLAYGIYRTDTERGEHREQRIAECRAMGLDPVVKFYANVPVVVACWPHGIAQPNPER